MAVFQFTPPSVPASGDLMLVLIASESSVSAPAGWTNLGSRSALGFITFTAFSKIATASETIPYNFTFASEATTFWYWEFSGVTAFDKASFANENANISGITVTSITPSQAGDLLFLIFATTPNIAIDYTVPVGWSGFAQGPQGTVSPITGSTNSFMSTAWGAFSLLTSAPSGAVTAQMVPNSKGVGGMFAFKGSNIQFISAAIVASASS